MGQLFLAGNTSWSNAENLPTPSQMPCLAAFTAHPSTLHQPPHTSSQVMKNSVARRPRAVESPSNASRRSLPHVSVSCAEE